MLIEESYLIEARPELAARLAGRLDPDFVEMLTEPVQLIHPRADRGPLRPGYHETAVKITFLASLRHYDGLKSDAECEAAFGSGRINAALFDRWWTIRKIPSPDDTTKELEEFVAANLASVDRTGEADIDCWLDWVGRQERQPRSQG